MCICSFILENIFIFYLKKDLIKTFWLLTPKKLIIVDIESKFVQVLFENQ